MGSAFLMGLGVGLMVMGGVASLLAILKPSLVKYPNRAKIIGVIAAILGTIIIASRFIS